MTWTPERLAYVKRRWQDGVSARAIAEELNCGLTRGAICGLIHRRKWQVRAKGEHHSNPGHRKPRERSKPKGNRFVKVSPPIQAAAAPVVLSEDDIPFGQRKTLMELGNEHCRYPVGDPRTEGFFFCGHPSADVTACQPYCRVHAMRCSSGSPDPRQPYTPARRAA